jgi:hypothetical protein
LHLLEAGDVTPWSAVKRKKLGANSSENSQFTKDQIPEIDQLLLDACNNYEFATQS